MISVLNISQREGGSVMNDNIEFISYTGLTKYLCDTVNNIKGPTTRNTLHKYKLVMIIILMSCSIILCQLFAIFFYRYSMSHQTGIEACESLRNFFGKCRDGQFRVLKVRSYPALFVAVLLIFNPFPLF